MKLLSRKPLLPSLLLLLIWFPCCVIAASTQEIKIGVLAKQGTEIAIQTWQPTAQYLSNKLPGYDFKIIPMDFDEIPLLVNKQLVDFAIVNSGIFIDLSVRFGLRRILTLKKRFNNGQQTTEFGSVIFTRSDNTKIYQLSDLKEQHLAAVHQTSFGGWIMALRELNDQGLNVNDLAEVHFENRHDAVVKSVLRKNVDAGIVRTDVLERLADRGELDINQLRILHEQHQSGFPFKLSTRLYPEWPLAKLQHTSSQLAKQVAIAMMQMPPQNEAAIAADIYGWTIPENYQPVHDILRELKLPPYQHYGEISLKKIVATYWYWVVAIVAVVLIQTALSVSISSLNKKLRKQQKDLTQSEERFKATFDQAAVGILHVSIDGELLRVNRKFCQILGYSETEILKFNLNDFSVSKESPEEFQQLDKMRKNQIDSFSYKKKLQRKDGSQIHALTTLSCIRASDGNIKYLVVVVDDVSEIIRLEAKINEQQKHHQLILDIAGDGILGLDTRGFHTYVNPAAASIFGWKIEEMLGKNSHEMWHHTRADGSHYAENECPITSVLVEGITHRSVNEIMWRKDGSNFNAEYISTPIFENDKITGAVVVVRQKPNAV